MANLSTNASGLICNQYKWHCHHQPPGGATSIGPWHPLLCTSSPCTLVLHDILFWSTQSSLRQGGQEKRVLCVSCRSPWHPLPGFSLHGAAPRQISVNKAVGGDDQCVRPPPVQGAHSQLPHHRRLPGPGPQPCERFSSVQRPQDSCPMPIASKTDEFSIGGGGGFLIQSDHEKIQKSAT